MRLTFRYINTQYWHLTVNTTSHVKNEGKNIIVTSFFDVCIFKGFWRQKNKSQLYWRVPQLCYCLQSGILWSAVFWAMWWWLVSTAVFIVQYQDYCCDNWKLFLQALNYSINLQFTLNSDGQIPSQSIANWNTLNILASTFILAAFNTLWIVRNLWDWKTRSLNTFRLTLPELSSSWIDDWCLFVCSIPQQIFCWSYFISEGIFQIFLRNSEEMFIKLDSGFFFVFVMCSRNSKKYIKLTFIHFPRIIILRCCCCCCCSWCCGCWCSSDG